MKTSDNEYITVLGCRVKKIDFPTVRKEDIPKIKVPSKEELEESSDRFLKFLIQNMRDQKKEFENMKELAEIMKLKEENKVVEESAPVTSSFKKDVEKDSEEETIKIKYFDPAMPRMQLKTHGNWIDCRAAKDYDLDPKLFGFTDTPFLIDLGFACKLPKGYEAHLAPRSSSFAKWGFLVVNSVGVIDETYCGDDDHWMLAVYPTRKAHINKYDRVCQFRIMKKQPNIIFEEVESLGNKSRGGFGSTGVK